MVLWTVFLSHLVLAIQSVSHDGVTDSWNELLMDSRLAYLGFV